MPAILLALLLGGCMVTYDTDAYTRARVDQLNSQQQCKALARTLVQIARCDVR